MQGKQCPKCSRHIHELFLAEKNRLRWEIDRCANPPCHYNFEIEEYKGSVKFFNDQVKRQGTE